jgi:segregation and condensation protein B
MELESRIEAIIFLSKEKISVDELVNHFKIDKQKMIEKIERLIEMRKVTGINIRLDNELISLVSNPLCGEDVRNFFNPELKIKKLTKSTMETLAIIAYKGPITKTEIENIRGVSVEKAMSNLLEKNLVYISGKRKGIGTPNEYRVTDEFYSYLNVTNEEDLPGFEEFSRFSIVMKIVEEENDESLGRIKI